MYGECVSVCPLMSKRTCWDVDSGCMVWASRGWRQSLDAAGCKLGGVRGLGRLQQSLLRHCGWDGPTCSPEVRECSATCVGNCCW